MTNRAGTKTYHILRTITWLPHGGIERRLVSLLPRLNQPPFRVSLVCIRERGPLAHELEQAGVPISVVPLRSRLDPAGLRALSRWMRSQQVDLVHSHMYRSNVPSTIAARMSGVRRILCQVHNIDSWDTPRQCIMDRLLTPWRTKLLAVSESVKKDIIVRLGCASEKVKVLYNGIDIKRYETAHPGPQLIRELNLSQGQRLVVMAARLVEQKRHTRLLRALEMIRDDLPPTRVVLVGDGKLRSVLEQEVAARRLSRWVSFLGHRDDVPEILSLAALSVLTSDKEGFSNAIVESLAAGVPVVATDVGGNREAVVNGECGFLVAPDDLHGLAQAIRKILVDDGLRKRMAIAAQERARSFSLDRMLEETRNLYLSTLSGSNP